MPTRGCRRGCANLTNRASHNNDHDDPTTLDVTLIDDAHDLDDILGNDLICVDWVSLLPEHFLAQTHMPWCAGIYVAHTSAPMHAAHRRLGARTQSRVELVPGACVLRGSNARKHWTLAMPPLLVGSITPAGDKARLWSERTRKLALLADADECVENIRYSFDVYRPRGPTGR